MTQVNMEAVYSNGSVSQDSVPLWKDPAIESAFRGPMRQMSMKTVHHNGSVSRDSVPLWKDSEGIGKGLHFSNSCNAAPGSADRNGLKTKPCGGREQLQAGIHPVLYCFNYVKVVQ